jgi:hypothetical protein
VDHYHALTLSVTTGIQSVTSCHRVDASFNGLDT